MRIKHKILSYIISLAIMIMSVPVSNIYADGNLSMKENDNAVFIDDEKIYNESQFSDDFAEDRVIAIMKHSASMDFKAYTVEDFSQINAKAVKDLTYATGQMVKAKVNKSDVVMSDGTIYKCDNNINTETYNQVLTIELNEPGKDKVIETIKLLEQHEDIMYVGPDYYLYFLSAADSDYMYNDPNEYQEWHMLRYAQEMLQLSRAWYYETGTRVANISIGVIDSGIDGDHPDLQYNLSSNLHKSFISETDNPLVDTSGHGTQVAGIIGARGNNYDGTSSSTRGVGVCWEANIISLKVATASEGATINVALSMVYEAIAYANLHGIDVLNLSAGTYALTDNQISAYTEAIDDYAGLFVCGAGNSWRDMDIEAKMFPASIELPNLISVGGCTNGDTMWSESNHGTTTVDLFAPAQYVFTCNNNGNYVSVTGTSFAAPFVSGAALLIKTQTLV